MKHILIVTFFIVSFFTSHAQTSKTKSTSRQRSATRAATGMHGSKDTTPGSPMGTGGAGGNEMSGSQAGSASETALRGSQAQTQTSTTNTQSGSEGSKSKKANAARKNGVHKNRRM